MKNILTIIKKELTRFFTDKKLLVTLLMPGIMIFAIYSIMGDVLKDKFSVKEDYEYNVCVINESNTLKDTINQALGAAEIKVKVENKNESDLDDLKTKIENKELDLVIYYEANFDQKFEENKMNGSSSILGGPNVEMYYNSTRTESAAIYSSYSAIFESVEDSISSVFNINFDTNKKFDMATEEDTTIQFATMLLPFLLVMLLFSGCMSIVPESISGEKERGTLATLLITPLKRKELAIGKIISLSVVSLCSALSSFIGLMASLPKLMGGMNTASVYGFKEYIFILGVLIVSVLLFVTILSIVSAQSKSVKEAGMYSTPILILVMVVGIIMMFNKTDVNIACYAIPIYNATQVLSDVLSLEINVLGTIITLISNVVYIGLGIFALTKMFDSEKIMFNK